jgi:hypothetical protein
MSARYRIPYGFTMDILVKSSLYEPSHLVMLYSQTLLLDFTPGIIPCTAGTSNMRSAGRMRPFASTPVARTKATLTLNCSFYNLNWINARRSQKKGMIFFIQNVCMHIVCF